MNHLAYLRHAVEIGRGKAAETKAQMDQGDWHHPFDSFTGLYYDLAKMELALHGEPLEPIREFAVEKALERMDARLDCADFVIPALIRMLKAHRGTPRLSEALAKKIDHSLIHFKYWLDEPGGGPGRKPVRRMPGLRILLFPGLLPYAFMELQRHPRRGDREACRDRTDSSENNEIIYMLKNNG